MCNLSTGNSILPNDLGGFWASYSWKQSLRDFANETDAMNWISECIEQKKWIA